MLEHICFKLNGRRVFCEMLPIFDEQLVQSLLILQLVCGNDWELKKFELIFELVHDHAQLETFDLVPLVHGEMDFCAHIQRPEK